MPQSLPVIDDRPRSADRVPTLTEVVELDLPASAPGDADAGVAAAEDGGGDTGEPAQATDAPEADADADADAPSIAATSVDAPSIDDLPPAPADPAVDTMPDDVPASAGADGDAATAADLAPAMATVDTAAALPPALEGPVLPAPPAAPALDVDAVVGQVLAALMPRIDMLLESRLREALAPALARAADGLIRDTRANVAVAMRDLVQEAVDRVLQRRADL